MKVNKTNCTMCGAEIDRLLGWHYSLKDFFGYGSKYDEERIELTLCCDCIDRVVDLIRPLCKTDPLPGIDIEEYYKSHPGHNSEDDGYYGGLLRKGVFWYIDGKIISKKVICDENGRAWEMCEYTSKSGDNFNHELEWEKLPRSITGNHPYNYYPRGRVEVKSGKVTVWINPTLEDIVILAKIKKEFGLDTNDIPSVLKIDNSEHYEAKYEDE